MQIEKNVVMQVFGSIMKTPSLLNDKDEYNLTVEDFSGEFEKNIFKTIYNLFSNGANSITVIDVDQYLQDYPIAYEIFNKHKGIEYLQDAADLSSGESFNYYYNKLKKCNAINDLKKMGIDTERFYPEESVFGEKTEEKIAKFEEMSVEEIFNSVKADLAEAESKYNCANLETDKANTGIKNLLEKLAASPDVGKALQGSIFNTIARGARRGKYYLMSAGSGVGKTRTMVAHSCYLAYPVRYNNKTCEWENTGSCEKVLYVATEQKLDEIQTLILAYLTGIDEDKICYSTYNEKEKEILDQAIAVMDLYQDNLIVARLPEPNMNQVKTLIRRYALKENIQYVFYDYIFITPSLLNEFRDLRIRDDQVLRMLSTLLKDLAAELNLFVMSATQITGDLKEVKGIRNELCLRDSKSIPDKADFGMITARVTSYELSMLGEFIAESGIKPNQVSDIYKNRRGKYVEVRVWSYFDLGRMRKVDLFITDASFQSIEDFNIVDFKFETEENYEKVIKFLNTGEVTEDEIINTLYPNKEIDMGENKVQKEEPNKTEEDKTEKENATIDQFLVDTAAEAQTNSAATNWNFL